MMTKKDYIRAAQLAGDAWEHTRTYETYDTVVGSFVCLFRGDNPRFDETRFRAACDTYKKAADE